MGGGVEVKSEGGKDTTFSAHLIFYDLPPLHQSLASLTLEKPAPMEAQLNLTVLAVDDGDSNLEVVETIQGISEPKAKMPIYASTADVTSAARLKESKAVWTGTSIKPTTGVAMFLALRRVSSAAHDDA